ncbi:KEOPS complex subunit Cgi121 [Halorubrum sp. JWXQ-INN 858]|uniref:KEOPS complex subunit Cgi121 n=1 Tax=Halorubrum sp. JWXQ-INN 858 TaxID=2690782 RepID=UPI003743085B
MTGAPDPGVSPAADRGSDTDRGRSSGTPPIPPARIVAERARIDDLDAFLDALAVVGEETGAVVQAFDADLVVSEAHLRRAVRLAARSIARGEAVARDPAVEVLLYAAGCRQIDRALGLGVSEGSGRVVVAVADFGDVPGADRPAADLDAAVAAVSRSLDTRTEPGGSRAEDGFDFDEAVVRSFYDVSDRELAATAGGLTDVVLERVALLDVEK